MDKDDWTVKSGPWRPPGSSAPEPAPKKAEPATATPTVAVVSPSPPKQGSQWDLIRSAVLTKKAAEGASVAVCVLGIPTREPPPCLS